MTFGIAPTKHQLPIVLLALLLCLLLPACSPCREICRDFDVTVSRAVERTSLTPVAGLDDQIAISMSEHILALTADRLTDALSARLRDGLPSDVRVPLFEIPIRTNALVDMAALRLVDLGGAVGADLDMTLNISAVLGGVGGNASAGVNGRVVVRAALALEGEGDAATLVLRLRESSLRDLRLTPTGVASLGRVGHVVTGAIEEAVRYILQPATLAAIGDLQLMTIQPIYVEGVMVRLAPNSLAFDDATSRLRIGLRTDLRVGVEEARFPRMVDSPADIEVLVSESLGQPLLASLLSYDGGRAFDASGRPDPDGPYRVSVSELTNRRRKVDFSYRLYRTSRPCLVADFTGTAAIDWADGRPVARIERHELTYASRFQDAVESSQPQIDGLSRRLTQLLTNGLTFDAISLPGGLTVELVPDGLTVTRAGYRVGWRVESSL